MAASPSSRPTKAASSGDHGPRARTADQVADEIAAERRSRWAVLDRGDRRRRLTPVAITGVLAGLGVAFAGTATHISMIQRQVELDGLRSEIAEVTTSTKELRQRESRLQTPDEIRRIALEYGMVDAAPAEAVAPTPLVISGGAPVADASQG